ncbi:hypothetical protein HDU93_006483, partial [Gonapodya sp. JEL0774]
GAKNAQGVQTSTCQGDSGGPHLVNGILYGITSFGPSPCDDGSPLVLVRLTGVSKWISGVFTTINAGGTYSANTTDISVSAVLGTGNGNATAITQTSGDFWEWPNYEIASSDFLLRAAATANSTDA